MCRIDGVHSAKTFFLKPVHPLSVAPSWIYKSRGPGAKASGKTSGEESFPYEVAFSKKKLLSTSPQVFTPIATLRIPQSEEDILTEG